MRIYNAAGPGSKALKDLETLLASKIPVITVGSVSLAPRQGNARQAYWFDAKSKTSLNSMGLPNKGIAYYEKILPDLIRRAHGKKKKIRVSIVAAGPREYAELVRRLRALRVDQIEVNTSCPNVWRGALQERIASFDLELLAQVIRQASRAAGAFKLDYKVSPYSDPALLARVAKLFARSRNVRAVVTANTFPNAFSARIGLAGLGGDVLRLIVLGQVRQFRTLLPRKIKIVALGGVSAKQHIKEYVAAGADEVQIGTHYFENGPGIFRSLC